MLRTRRWSRIRNTNACVPDVVSVLESRTASGCCLASGTENDLGVQIADGKKQDRRGEKADYKKLQKINDER